MKDRDEMTTTDQAARFRQLHTGPVLVLPNAWDAASAALIEAAGAAAIATTSAGVSWALGTHDSSGLDRQSLAAAVSRIVQAVSVPVSADVESGYGQEPGDVAQTVRVITDAGAVGINLEDSPGAEGQPLQTAPAQARRIAEARKAAEANGVNLFINARTDVFLFGVGDPGGRLADVQERAAAYAEAGADGLFVPGLLDLEVIAELAAGPLALNIMVGPGAPSVDELAKAGAARVSAGSSLAQATYGFVARAAKELLTSGTYESLAGEVDYGTLNSLLG